MENNEIHSYFKREGPGHSHNFNKVKPNSHSEINSTSNVWDLLIIFWVLSRDLKELLRLCSLQHTQPVFQALLGQLASLHHCCCSWWLCHGASIFINAGYHVVTGLHFHQQLSGTLCKYSSPAMQGHASAALYDPFMPSNQYHLGGSYTAKFSYPYKCDLGHLWSSASECGLRGNTSQKVLSQWCGSLFNHC